MGSWGFGVMQDDDAADAYDSVKKLYNRSIPKDVALVQVMEEYRSELQDSDIGLPILLGIAKACWTFGWLDESMILRVESEIQKSSGLARWSEGKPKDVAKRQAALQTFLSQLKTTPAKIPKPKKPIQRKPPYREGACLSFRMKDGRYAALLVLDQMEIDPTGEEETYGWVLLGALDRAFDQPPTLDDFRTLKVIEFRYPPPHDADGPQFAQHWVTPSDFRQEREKIAYVGDIAVPEWHTKGGPLSSISGFEYRVVQAHPKN